MKKKTSMLTSLILLLLILCSCEQEDQFDTIETIRLEDKEKRVNDPLNILPDREQIEKLKCDQIIKIDLIDGQQTYIGNIFLFKKEDYLVINYDLTSTDWYLEETHIFIGDIKGVPSNKNGYTNFEKFPYSAKHELIKSFSYEIALEDLDACFSIVTHASAALVANGSNTTSKSAFGYGPNKLKENQFGWYSILCDLYCESTSNSNEVHLENKEKEGANEVLNEPAVNSVGGMDAYAYINSEKSKCFMPDFDRWGWTNKVISNPDHHLPGGQNYNYPLYASAYDCDPENSILIGEVSINVSGEFDSLFATISITLSKPELSITNLDVFANSKPFPENKFGNPSIAFTDFDISLNSLNVKTYVIADLDWFDQTNFIVHINVCPEEILS